MENNLLNVTVKNPAFRAWADRILSLTQPRLGAAEQALLEQLKLQLWITTGDAFFLHYSLYPVLRPQNPDAFLNAILAALKEYIKTDDYRELRARTVYNELVSTIHAQRLVIHLLEELLKKQEEKRRRERERREEEEGGDAGSPSPGATAVEQGGSAITATIVPAPSQAQPLFTPDEVKEAMQRALKLAKEDAETADEAVKVMGGQEAGKKPGSFERTLNLLNDILGVSFSKTLLAFARRVEAGVPLFVKLAKERHPRRGEDVYGLRVTMRVEEALPRELALPDELFYYKLASEGLLAREYVSVREGAYYVLLDKSGSMMEGSKTLWSRSVALALLKLAQRKKRKYFLRFFDTQTWPQPDELPLSDPGAILKELVSVRADGGTSIDTAIRTALDDLKRHKLADYTNTIIIITDGVDRVTTPPRLLEETGTVLTAVMIQGFNETLRHLARASGGQFLKATPDEKGGLKVIEVAKR